jgi:hypothetical protein
MARTTAGMTTTMHVFAVHPAVETSVDVGPIKAAVAVDEICATVYGLNHVPAVPPAQHVLAFLTKDIV